MSSLSENVTAAEVKALAKRLGADLVGISPMSRWEGAPKQNDPRYIFPGAKSMIVLAFRIPRGLLRGIEEGTRFLDYPGMGYASLNQVYGPMVLWKLNAFLEERGYESVPYLNSNGGDCINPVTGMFRNGLSRPVEEGKPLPDVLVHFRIAAYLAGLGEFGWSKVFLTPEFGPRQRFALMFTDAELEPDPIFEGKICDRCKLCVKSCSGRAISMTESVKVTLAGHEVEWADIDVAKCNIAFRGAVKTDTPQSDPYMLNTNTVPGSWSPFYHKPRNLYNTGQAVCGSRGCTRACMISLESRGVLQNTFKQKFRRRPEWSVDWSTPYDPEKQGKEDKHYVD